MRGRLALLVGERAQRRLGLVGDAALGLAALVVGGVELGGDLARPRVVVGQHQLDAGVGAVEAARRRSGAAPRRKAMSPSSTRSGSTFATSISARMPGPAGPAQLGEPAPGEGPVLVDERDEVGDGRQRDEVEVASGRRRRRRRSRSSAWTSLWATAAPQSPSNG